MKLQLTNYETIAVLTALITNDSRNGEVREKSYDLAKGLSLLDRILEIHGRGKMEYTVEQVAAMPLLETDVSKDFVRKLQKYLSESPSSGTNTFVLHVLDGKLSDLLRLPD